MTDQNEIAKMRLEANRELNGIKSKKTTVTRNINKCLKLVEVCKGESQINSPLLKQSAEDIMTHYIRAQSSLNKLEASMEKYLTLMTHTHQNKDDIVIHETEEDNQDSLQQLIDQNMATIDEYSTKFHNIRRSNIDKFQVIDTTLNPIQRTSVRAVQAAPQIPMLGGFKLSSDLRPNLLVKEFTLKEINTFSESFYNYMKSSPNSIIPEGALWAHINVNVDQQ